MLETFDRPAFEYLQPARFREEKKGKKKHFLAFLRKHVADTLVWKHYVAKLNVQTINLNKTAERC